MNIKLSSIELDVSIQCRASIDTGLVNEYAERMSEGDKFPPVVLYGTKDKSWIGDGWHRIMAAQQVGDKDINAELHKGGRADALKHALGANVVHGNRRTNADKTRCVEIALREFSKLSNRAIAELCGVSYEFVRGLRQEQLTTVVSSPERTIGRDGKERPAHRERPEPEEDQEAAEPEAEAPAVPHVNRGREDAIQRAINAINELKEIPRTEDARTEAFEMVKNWIDQNQ